MATPNVANTLANVPIFSGCSKRELGIIARASKEVSHKQGTVIAREGERGIGLFLILDGQCKVTIGGKTKARLGPGDFFGEVALLDGGPRTATVTALSPVRLVDITETCGDASKARRELGWAPKTGFDDLVRLMVEAELADLDAHGDAA